MKFVLIDESKGAKTTQGQVMTPAFLLSIASSCTVQLNREFSAEYGGNYQVRAAASQSDVMPDEVPFVLLDALPNAPGAIAYHTQSGNGNPLLFDGITLSDTIAGLGNSVSCAISHELLETAADPGANLWAADGVSIYSREVCDPFENRSYTISNIGVSDFALQSYFIPGAPGPYSYMKRAGTNSTDTSKPLTTNSGLGYQMISAFAPQTIKQMMSKPGVSGFPGPGSVLDIQGAMTRRPMAHGNSRRARRGWVIPI